MAALASAPLSVMSTSRLACTNNDAGHKEQKRAAHRDERVRLARVVGAHTAPASATAPAKPLRMVEVLHPRLALLATAAARQKSVLLRR